MTTTTTQPFDRAAALPAAAPQSARIVFRLLAGLRFGTLDVALPTGDMLHFGHADGAQESAAPSQVGSAPSGSAVGAAQPWGRPKMPRASIRLVDWSVCGAALRSGDIGFAEAYIAGGWTTPDLPSLLRLLVANRDAIGSVVYGTWWGALWHRMRHGLRRNSRAGSRKNIHAHYDLGNDFYRLWLDPTMNYSSAWFEGDHGRSLVDAQWAKVRRTLAECGLGRGDRVLEIGCGWGALAELAGREFGAHVTGLTLSAEQLAYGRQRLAEAGVAGDLRFEDYRDHVGSAVERYDAVTSIEMFEAVGRAWWPEYFRTVHAALKPGGRACIQSIVIRDDLYARYVRSTDFIQQYIFPGGQLPSRTEFRKAAADAGFTVVRELDFGADYAETLRRWRVAFHGADAAVRRLGFDTRFMRIWEFYLAYCEAAFDTGNTGVVQFTLQRN